jgi:hypothetical protein
VKQNLFTNESSLLCWTLYFKKKTLFRQERENEVKGKKMKKAVVCIEN